MAKRATTKGKREKAAPLPPKEEATKVKPSEAVALINEKNLTALLKADKNFQEEIDTVSGQKREKIAYAVSKQHLDKEVYAIAKRFEKWTPEKLAAKWPLLLAYMDMLGLMARIESVAELDLRGGSDDEAEEDAERPARPGPAFGGPTSRAVAALAESAGVSPQSE